jgi:hypothetical protein
MNSRNSNSATATAAEESYAWTGQACCPGYHRTDISIRNKGKETSGRSSTVSGGQSCSGEQENVSR